MTIKKATTNMVHKVPTDMQKVFKSSKPINELWQDITPLAKNEWVCWVTSAKKVETREKRIQVMQDKLLKGMRRPCCWEGCPHR